VASFLNTFETSTRHRLAKIDEKLLRIERRIDLVEASFSAFDGE
jgi:hypothetical protein